MSIDAMGSTGKVKDRQAAKAAAPTAARPTAPVPRPRRERPTTAPTSGPDFRPEAHHKGLAETLAQLGAAGTDLAALEAEHPALVAALGRARDATEEATVNTVLTKSKVDPALERAEQVAAAALAANERARSVFARVVARLEVEADALRVEAEAAVGAVARKLHEQIIARKAPALRMVALLEEQEAELFHDLDRALARSKPTPANSGRVGRFVHFLGLPTIRDSLGRERDARSPISRWLREARAAGYPVGD